MGMQAGRQVGRHMLGIIKQATGDTTAAVSADVLHAVPHLKPRTPPPLPPHSRAVPAAG